MGLAQAAASERSARQSRAVTAYLRPKQTPRRVVWQDRIADWTISIGGLAVILAVVGIMAFLVEVVVPLFVGGRVVASHRYALPNTPGRPLAVLADEEGVVAGQIDASGAFVSFHLPSGRPLQELALNLGPAPVTSFARTIQGGDLVFGFADGSVRFGRFDFDASIVAADQVPGDAIALDGGDRTDGVAVYAALPDGQVRRIAVEVELLEAEPVSPTGRSIVALDYRVGGNRERPTRAVVAVDDAGAIVLTRSESRMNLLTRELTTDLRRSLLPPVAAASAVAGVLLTQRADEVLLAHVDGTLQRFDARDFERPTLAETRDVAPGSAEITSMGFLIGEQSLVIGTSTGDVHVYFRADAPDARTSDGRALVLAHELEPHATAVTAFAPSERSKAFATADAQGAVWLRHATSEQVLLRPAAERGAKVTALSLASRDDGIVTVDASHTATYWRISVPHPETTLRTIFGRVWYEGYPEPTHTWQSSSGTDVFEPKFSLVPLVFGTLKATVYSLLFAVPLALLAAVYTSEFIHPRVRAAVKPAMEMMASLPSVVLGFIAALVLAPLVETWIASVLLFLVAFPFTLFVGALLWQALPRRLALRLDGVAKLGLMFLAIGLAALLAVRLGAPFEAAFFGGDFRLWLAGGRGSGDPLLFLILLPLSFGIVAWSASRLLGERMDAWLRQARPLAAAGIDGARWVAVLAAAAGVSFALASLAAALGLDPRNGLVGTYVQRNTLVVGFAMGFAVIPIIYTIAEDAMSAVPSHLRAASLACGATPWQTAIRVIVPTATSGIFAAVMVGMGRAVGETMIVVMAAGNTPILDWNVFNGLRALSANIAVELPEAVKDSSLYRMLFLAALTLFAMTFVVNTVAEVVRLRFRRRAAQL
jgi:phosphate transport system permease protein